MKKYKSILRIFSIALFMLFTTSIYAQFSQIGSFMAGSADDAEKLLGAYERIGDKEFTDIEGWKYCPYCGMEL